MKKIIALIVGLLLILAGLGLRWFNNHEQSKAVKETEVQTVVEEPAAVEEEVQEAQEVKEEENKAEVKETAVPKVKTAVKTVKPAKKAPEVKKQTQVKVEEPTTVLKESVVESKELEDPYVAEDGSVVVQNEFKPKLREKIRFRGVVYQIKTRFTEANK